MSDLFSEYGWTCVAVLGGFIGIMQCIQIFFTDGCPYWVVISKFLEQLM